MSLINKFLKKKEKLSPSCPFIGILVSCGREQKVIYRPVIDSEWWDITGQPDLGGLTCSRQEPVDFGVWKATDGTWQLWSSLANPSPIYAWQNQLIYIKRRQI